MKTVSLKSLLVGGVLVAFAGAAYVSLRDDEATLPIMAEQQAVAAENRWKSSNSVAAPVGREAVTVSANKSASVQSSVNGGTVSIPAVPIEHMQNSVDFNAPGAGTATQKANAATAAGDAYKAAQEQNR